MYPNNGDDSKIFSLSFSSDINEIDLEEKDPIMNSKFKQSQIAIENFLEIEQIKISNHQVE